MSGMKVYELIMRYDESKIGMYGVRLRILIYRYWIVRFDRDSDFVELSDI